MGQKAVKLRSVKILVCCILGLSYNAFASKYAGEFLNIGLGSAAMGMGGAYVSIANDAFAGYWNPAGTSYSGHQVIFSHSSFFGSLIAHDAIGYSRPMGNYALGLVYLRLAVKDIPYTNDALIDLNNNGIMDAGERLDESLITYNDDVESALLVNYSQKFRLSSGWGINLKFVNKSLGENSAWGLGVDAGAMTSWNEKIKIGINLQDITTTYLAWNNGTKEVVSPTIRIGSSYHPKISGERPLSLSIAGDFRFENRRSAANYHWGSTSLDLHLGMEYWLKKRIALRLGGDQGRFSAGVGIKIGRLGFDYSYLAHKYLENSTRLTGSYTF